MAFAGSVAESSSEHYSGYLLGCRNMIEIMFADHIGSGEHRVALSRRKTGGMLKELAHGDGIDSLVADPTRQLRIAEDAPFAKHPRVERNLSGVDKFHHRHGSDQLRHRGDAHDVGRLHFHPLLSVGISISLGIEKRIVAHHCELQAVQLVFAHETHYD